jgi:uncharacterized protein (DUF1800 family)
MGLNRRAFNVSSLALLFAGSFNNTTASAAGATTNLFAPLNRLTFGANHNSVGRFLKQGLETWLEVELAKPVADERLGKRLSAARLMIEYEAGTGDHGTSWPARKDNITYQYFGVAGEKLLPLLDFDKHPMSYEERIRPAREVQVASLIRAVHADAQLREVMTQFWHDHFNVNSMRDEHTAAYFSVYDAMLREHAFGNFRKLLGEVSRSPSMLFYLNNEASKASPANENFARELFELHTLGVGNYLNDRTTNWSDVPGAKDGLAQGYIDQDVYEAARALTGWSFGDGRYVAEGDNAPMTGAFHYIDRWHDPYQKRILAVEFRANAGPMGDGEKLLDILAHHPGTAHFLCTKICRRLLADDPPASLLEKAVAAWRANIDAYDQIAKVIRAIVLSPEFAAEPSRKLKRPFEFLASFYRATNAEVTSPSLWYIWNLSKAGWNQHEFRPPTGHSDVATYWANTNLIFGFVTMALNALEDWNDTAKTNLAAQLPEGTTRMDEAFQFWISRMQSADAPPEVAQLLMAQMDVAADAQLPADFNERERVLRGLVAAASLTPEFLFR